MRSPHTLLVCAVVLAATLPASGAVPPDAGRLDASICRAEDRVSAVDLVPTPTPSRVGEPTLLTFRMNVHCALPISWRIQLGGRIAASGTQEPPATLGGLVTVAATWTPSIAGDQTIRAVADPENLLGETDDRRKNNTVEIVASVMVPRDPTPAPSPPTSPSPTPTPPVDARGEPGAKGNCTAWERSVSGRGEGLITVRRARGGPSGFDYSECTRRLAVEVAKVHCSPADRKQLAKRSWYLQQGDLALVLQTAECR